VSAITPQAIREAVRLRAHEIIEWTGRLIRLPSENRPPCGDEGLAQEFIEAECAAFGMELDAFSPEDISSIREHPCWLPGREYPEGRRNVVARWPGGGVGRSLLLGGHVDVAPSEPDNWTICAPYEPIVRDGRLYGRGAADMKGGLASALWALRILRDLGFEPAGDILLESVVDEEFAGGNGTLAARMRGHNAELAVLCEPTRMELCPACFGAFLGELILTGKAGMPYMGTAFPNPINAAARVVELFAQWQEQWRSTNSHPLFTAPDARLRGLLWRISSAEEGALVQMGTPRQTRISWIVWCYPGATEEEFYRAFRAFWSERAASDPALAPFELTVEPAFHYVRPWETPADSPAVEAVKQAFTQYEGSAPTVAGAPFSCDLALYGDVGQMPCVILGPRGDNLHGPDEWVEISDVLELVGVYATLALNWCGEASRHAQRVTA